MLPIIGGLAAGLLMIAVIGAALGGGGDQAPTGGAPVVEEASGPAAAADVYTLTVTSANGDKLHVTYSNGKGGMDSADVRSGWSTTVPDSFLPPTLGVTNTGMGSSDTITCKVSKGSRVISESTGEGQFASAFC